MENVIDDYQNLFEEIRRLHNRLRWLGDQAHEAAGQSSAKRSLLLSLHREGPCTVPDLARERLVSRQIIQTQINLLMEEGLVASQVNPRHKRSRQMVLTRNGRQIVEKMLVREAELLMNAGSPLRPPELRETVERLQKFRLHLENNDIQL